MISAARPCIRKSLFLDRLSEAGNEKYCYELHARSGLRFIIRHNTAKLQHNARYRSYPL